jgi:hypothetical protein
VEPLGQVLPQSRFEAQPSQVLRHAVVNLVSNTAAFGGDGLRLAPALHFGCDVFNRDDHVTGICRIGSGDEARGKNSAVPALVDGLGCYGLALLHPLYDGQDIRPGSFWEQLGSRHAHQLGCCVAIDQLHLAVSLQDDRGGNGQVGNKDADGHMLEQVSIALLAGLAGPIGLVSHHDNFAPSIYPTQSFLSMSR